MPHALLCEKRQRRSLSHLQRLRQHPGPGGGAEGGVVQQRAGAGAEERHRREGGGQGGPARQRRGVWGVWVRRLAQRRGDPTRPGQSTRAAMCARTRLATHLRDGGSATAATQRAKAATWAVEQHSAAADASSWLGGTAAERAPAGCACRTAPARGAACGAESRDVVPARCCRTAGLGAQGFPWTGGAHMFMLCGRRACSGDREDTPSGAKTPVSISGGTVNAARCELLTAPRTELQAERVTRTVQAKVLTSQPA